MEKNLIKTKQIITKKKTKVQKNLKMKINK